MMSKNKMIIGIVGHPSCGKDTVAEYVVKKYDFAFVSTSDMIRDYIRKHNLGEPTRERMHDVANEWRAREGGDILIRKALEINRGRDRIILAGIRTLAEAEAVRKTGGKIIAITAPIETRYTRAKARGRIGDGVTFAQFKDTEEKEAAGSDPNVQNVNAVVATADFVLNNSGTIYELCKQVDGVIGVLTK